LLYEMESEAKAGPKIAAKSKRLKNGVDADCRSNTATTRQYAESVDLAARQRADGPFLRNHSDANVADGDLV